MLQSILLLYVVTVLFCYSLFLCEQARDSLWQLGMQQASQAASSTFGRRFVQHRQTTLSVYGARYSINPYGCIGYRRDDLLAPSLGKVCDGNKIRVTRVLLIQGLHLL
jgi:hypothetical protein